MISFNVICNFCFCLFAMPGIESQVLCMVCRCSTLCYNPSLNFSFICLFVCFSTGDWVQGCSTTNVTSPVILTLFLRQGFPKLLRLTLNFRSSYLRLLNHLDYRCVPLCSAASFFFFSKVRRNYLGRNFWVFLRTNLEIVY